MRFALDTEVTPGFWVYGRDRPDHEKAMKSACHELKAVSCKLTLFPGTEND